MTPERFAQIDRICDAALDRPAADRRAFLDRACGTDDELRREVESLLEAHDRSGDFIAEPAAVVVAGLFDEADAGAPSFAPGDIVGRYELLSLLGAGGMGEVYLAADATLGRKVALKVLPNEFTDDADRIQRFELEARAASALNHPNILTIYEIGHTAGLHFIAAELVDGETLRSRVTKSRMPIAEAVDVAIQIASALDVAHGAGVIHRDIKPENVMMRRDHLVKVLDFGLTKLTEQAEPAAPEQWAVSRRQAVLMDHTDAGLLLGTVRYMSPEQTRDSSQVDHRTDLWSLGVVLYEMVAGRTPFEGNDVVDGRVIAIREGEPPRLATHAAEIPEHLEAIVRKALARDVNQRYQTAKELLVDLRNLARSLEEGEHTARAAAPGSTFVTTISGKRGVLVALMLFAAVAAAAFAAYQWADRGQSSNNVSTSAMPRIVPFTSFPGAEMEPSFSPDGKQIAFAWNGPDADNYDTYVKPLDSGSPRRLTSHTAEDRSPSWSPDGRSIAIIRSLPNEDVIVLASADGGPERVLHSVAPPSIRVPGHSLSWSPDGQSLAFSDRTSPVAPFQIHFLSVASRQKRTLTWPPVGIHGDRFPAISPDGHMLAFIRRGSNDVDDVYLARLSGGEATRLTSDNTTITGLAWTSNGREVIYSSGRGGARLLWRIAASGGPAQLMPVGPENPTTVAVSSQGTVLAYSSTHTDTNIWRVDIPRTGGRPVKLISSTRADVSPQYSPDGGRIVFSTSRTGSLELWTCDSDGTNAVRLTSLGGPGLGTPRWSPDGRHIAFDSTADGQREIYVASVDGGKLRRLTFEPAADVRPSWSADGRSIYFGSDRTGQPQVWKAPAEGGPARQVTTQGGREAFESHDGQFVYYAKENVPGLWRVPAEGGEEARILGHVRQGAWALWTQGVYFVNPEARPHRSIEFYSFASGRTTPVATIDKELLWSAPNLATTADGRHILYVQVDQTESDIILVERFSSGPLAGRP